jgi:hypothetical protein
LVTVQVNLARGARAQEVKRTVTMNPSGTFSLKVRSKAVVQIRAYVRDVASNVVRVRPV